MALQRAGPTMQQSSSQPIGDDGPPRSATESVERRQKEHEMPRLRVSKSKVESKSEIGPETGNRRPLSTDEQPTGFPVGEKGARTP